MVENKEGVMVQVSALIPLADREALDKMSQRERISRGELVRDAIGAFIEARTGGK